MAEAPTAIAKQGTLVWKTYNKFDDSGKCASILTKLVHGGCFVAGTTVTVSELPYAEARESRVWSETDWLSNNDYSYSPSPRFGEKGPGDEGLGFDLAYSQTSPFALRTALLIPIEQVPLGARIPTKNPKPWEYDDSLPDPVQADWAKISITMHRNDGGIVDAELIRPQWWIAQKNIIAGKLLPMNIEELQVKGTAMVTSIDDCPEIADGEGSVVTSRFCTREVNTIVRAEILGPDGSIEIIEGTPIHPIWTVDRNDWVPLGELTVGESLQASEGLATVLSLTRVSSSIPVYNVEVHGQHVYQIGVLATVVHNSDFVCRIGGGKVDNLLMSTAEEGLTPPGISVILAGSADEAALVMRNAFPSATGLIEKSGTTGRTTTEKIREAGYELLFKPS